MSGPGRLPRKGPGSVLLMISCLMIGSAVLRVGLEAAPALARNQLSDEQIPNSAVGANSGSEDLHEVLAALQQREARIEQREAAVAERVAALQLADAALQRKLVELTEAEESLRLTLALADGAAEGDLTRLTDMYRKMKPKEAAALFQEMAPDFAAGFLSRMPPEAAAGILANLEPGSAYTISVVLAGRNVSVPKE